MRKKSVASLTFLSSRASFLLATVSLGEKDWRASQAMFGDIFSVVFVPEVSTPDVGEDVSLTAKGCGIYPGPWRRSPCVTGTPPSQLQTIWTGHVFEKNNTKLSNRVR